VLNLPRFCAYLSTDFRSAEAQRGLPWREGPSAALDSRRFGRDNGWRELLRPRIEQPAEQIAEEPGRAHAFSVAAAAVGVAVDDQPLVGVGQAIEEGLGRDLGEVALAVGDEGRVADGLDIDGPAPHLPAVFHRRARMRDSQNSLPRMPAKADQTLSFSAGSAASAAIRGSREAARRQVASEAAADQDGARGVLSDLYR
jgi:hypothetical protein